MEQDLVQQLIDLVTKTAPEMWRIAKMQVLAINIQDFIIGVACAGLVVFLINLLKKLKVRVWDSEKHEYLKEEGCIYLDDTILDVTKVFSTLAIIVLGIITVCNFVSIVMRLVNPDYYAIVVLLNLIK
jgi:hypothetical protein